MYLILANVFQLCPVSAFLQGVKTQSLYVSILALSTLSASQEEFQLNQSEFPPGLSDAKNTVCFSQHRAEFLNHTSAVMYAPCEDKGIAIPFHTDICIYVFLVKWTDSLFEGCFLKLSDYI